MTVTNSSRLSSIPSTPSNSSFAWLQPWIALTRVKKFAGTMVVFWPFAWGLTMAAKTLLLPIESFSMILAFGFIGASILHSAGCVWNDILDQDFDRQVERTKNRPIANGSISTTGGLLFLFAHIAILIAINWKSNIVAWYIGLMTSLPLPALYPLMKRITYWPQAWLGITLNTGPVLAWAYTTGAYPTSSIVLSAGCWAWTIWYDTIYACQDMRDDVKAGVKSTALLFHPYIKEVLSLFGAAVVASLYFAGKLNEQQLPYFVVSVGGGSLHLFSQLWSVNLEHPKECWKAFHDTAFTFGGIVWGGLMLDYALSLSRATVM